MKRNLFLTSLLVVAVALVWLPIAAMADSITPVTFTGSGPTGASYTVDKTVTINKGTPTTSLVDVFLLSDTTGSMGDVIGSVQTSANAIVTAASGLGDVAFGVGEYKDKTTAGDPFNFRVNTAVTKNLPNITAGIGAWSASGGGDLPEQDLYALDQVAKNGAGDGATAVGWRPGAAKLVVWFGDAPSHDPSGAGSPGGPVTGATTIADLVAAGVKVAGVNITHFGQNMDSAGQVTAITSATGGAMFAGIPNASDIAAIIEGLLETILSTYKVVGLDTSEVPAGVGVSVTPGSYSGAFDRSIDRTFEFSVTFTDLELGTHTFNIYATVDGSRVATESDSITSTAGGEVPEPATMILIGSGLLGIAGLRKRFKK
jgi:hypothetical protein